MSHFNLKTLSFYGAMIGSVLVLFNIVSNYGENTLKAPVKIAGNYPLELLKNPNLPDCLKSKKLNLTIEQSGIYLAGELSLNIPDTENSNSSEIQKVSQSSSVLETKNLDQTIKLNGSMTPKNTIKETQAFVLTGQTGQLGDCSASENNLPKIIQLNSQFQKRNKTLSGQLQWSSLNVNFIAKSQNLTPKKDH